MAALVLASTSGSNVCAMNEAVQEASLSELMPVKKTTKKTSKKKTTTKKTTAKKATCKATAKCATKKTVKAAAPKHIGLVKNDPYLADFEPAIVGRHEHALWKLNQLTRNGKISLSDCANGYD